MDILKNHMNKIIYKYKTILKNMWRTRLGSRSKTDDATYYADGMATWGKAADFLQSNKFWEAYLAGENSGHNLSQGLRLHVEWRVHIAICMAIHGSKLNGDFVECGVNTGILSLAICNYLEFNKLDKKIYLFDTYNGIPVEKINLEEKKLGRLQESNSLYFDCYEIAKSNFSKFPNAILVKGTVPESLSQVSIQNVSYLHIDMNSATAELAALQFFWEKLSCGAAVLFDDYGWKNFQPQREALNKFAESKKSLICELPTGQGLLIKY
jgi:O-methyltransferase